ncbi:hypothetical protein [Paraburkholderia adhaesiva]|uniref:hypothetical protein n=1 Tax=Paraburkholderia adhaesiva TaxID=2883244 RepID=UPI001F180C1B|nr:hypothetical protein [Paraburkholderia adhaesiva]
MSASVTFAVERAASSCDPESLESVREAARAEAARQQPARSGAALHAYAARLLAGELARCERSMTPEQWAEHRAWIEENARVSLLMALRERAERGEL